MIKEKYLFPPKSPWLIFYLNFNSPKVGFALPAISSTQSQVIFLRDFSSKIRRKNCHFWFECFVLVSWQLRFGSKIKSISNSFLCVLFSGMNSTTVRIQLCPIKLKKDIEQKTQFILKWEKPPMMIDEKYYWISNLRLWMISITTIQMPSRMILGSISNFKENLLVISLTFISQHFA